MNKFITVFSIILVVTSIPAIFLGVLVVIIRRKKYWKQAISIFITLIFVGLSFFLWAITYNIWILIFGLTYSLIQGVIFNYWLRNNFSNNE